MSLGAMVRYADDVLGRAHALFGDPRPPGEGVAAAARSELEGARDTLDSARGRVSGLSGGLPADYGAVATDAHAALDTAAAVDDRLDSRVRDATTATHAGRNASGRIAHAASEDTARVAPLTGTPAGQRALIAALRDRVMQQARVVASHQARDARMAALVRALGYPPGSGMLGGSTVRPSGGGTSIGGGAGGRPISGGMGVGTVEAAATHSAPLGRLNLDSSARDCAATLIAEARRRGYSPAQTVAMLSTMLQESGGNPRAMSLNGLWRSLFQQDAGYPGRDDPNTAISGFLDRLSAKGGPASTDIWKMIFWLQQAPGAPSAEAAYAGGRRAYLQEIQSQLGRATAMYQDLAVE